MAFLDWVKTLLTMIGIAVAILVTIGLVYVLTIVGAVALALLVLFTVVSGYREMRKEEIKNGKDL
jgi:hypothetical protein